MLPGDSARAARAAYLYTSTYLYLAWESLRSRTAQGEKNGRHGLSRNAEKQLRSRRDLVRAARPPKAG
jgi:hypothetical protein